jgi:FixJ family two-component response regulator
MTPDRKHREQGVVHVLDDDESLRTALARLLGAMGYEVRTHATAASFLVEPVADGPSCLILDLRMPDVSGLEVQDALARLRIDIPIIFLTGHGDISTTVQAMRAGASDFLTKPVKSEQLLGAVRAALASRNADKAGPAQRGEIRARFELLTAPERDVFEAVASGELNHQIAARLNIAELAVKDHYSRVMEKMQARSAADLMRQAELLGK